MGDGDNPTTSPPYSPSPSKEREKIIIKEGLTPLLTPHLAVSFDPHSLTLELITGIITENGLPALAEVISYMERHQD